MTKKHPAAPIAPKLTLQIPADRKQGDLSPLGGSASDQFNTTLVDGLLKALPQSSAIFGEKMRDAAYTAAAMGQFEGNPGNVFEAMMIAQIQVAHAAANELHRLSWVDGQPFEIKSRYLGLADKAQRTMGLLIEALDKHRRGGQQVVRIERVDVHAGAQAIVGNVERGTK